MRQHIIEHLGRLRRMFAAGHHTQGTFFDGDHRYCLVGGLRHVYGFGPHGELMFHDGALFKARMEYTQALNVLQDQLPPQRRGRGLISFNDRTTTDDVIALLDRAIAAEEGRLAATQT